MTEKPNKPNADIELDAGASGVGNSGGNGGRDNDFGQNRVQVNVNIKTTAAGAGSLGAMRGLVYFLVPMVTCWLGHTVLGGVSGAADLGHAYQNAAPTSW